MDGRLVTESILDAEGHRLAQYLRPDINQNVSLTLQSFSLDEILTTAQQLAPVLCASLRSVVTVGSGGEDASSLLQ
jgi:hypothetical protein